MYTNHRLTGYTITSVCLSVCLCVNPGVCSSVYGVYETEGHNEPEKYGRLSGQGQGHKSKLPTTKKLGGNVPMRVYSKR